MIDVAPIFDRLHSLVIMHPYFSPLCKVSELVSKVDPAKVKEHISFIDELGIPICIFSIGCIIGKLNGMNTYMFNAQVQYQMIQKKSFQAVLDSNEADTMIGYDSAAEHNMSLMSPWLAWFEIPRSDLCWTLLNSAAIVYAAVECNSVWKALCPNFKEQFTIGKFRVDMPALNPHQVYNIIQGVAIGRIIRISQKPPKKTNSKSERTSDATIPSTNRQDDDRLG